MSREGNRHWYVVRTKPRAEAFAAAGLRAHDVEVYFPRLVVGAWGRDAAATEPLFPGYLFVHLDLARQFASAAWTPGVRSFVGFGDGAPEPVAESVIDVLRGRAEGGEVLRPRPAMRIGEAVEVRSGPFAGLLGIIDRPVSGPGRVQVLLEILRRQTRVDLGADQVVRL
jgi:transcriptional antiterminator RfaH